MMTTEEKPKKGRGRPRKVKLTPKTPKLEESPVEAFGPDRAADIFIETILDDETSVSIFGLDSFTEVLIEKLWINPHISKLYCSDISQEKLNFMNKKISSRSFSLFRWEVRPTSDFLQFPKSRICVVSAAAKDIAAPLAKQGIQLVVLEELNVD